MLCSQKTATRNSDSAISSNKNSQKAKLLIQRSREGQSLTSGEVSLETAIEIVIIKREKKTYNN